MTWRDPLNLDDFPILGARFAECVAGAQLAGLARLEILLHYGGIYLDADVEPTGLVLDTLLVHPAFLGAEDHEWCNDAVLGAEPRHPGIVKCVALARDIDLALGPGVTGPQLVSQVLRNRADVTRLSSRAFCPYHYTHKATGATVSASDFSDSFGVHRWAFSWEGTT